MKNERLVERKKKGRKGNMEERKRKEGRLGGKRKKEKHNNEMNKNKE